MSLKFWNVICLLMFPKILSSASFRRRVNWRYNPYILTYEVGGDNDYLHAQVTLRPIEQPPLLLGKAAECPLDGVCKKP